MTANAGAGAPAPGKRLAALDLCRGGAVLLMAVYHFSWDLAYFGLAEFRLLDDPFWLGFRYFILGSFLVVAGVSMSLASAKGISRRSFLRRLARVAGCALLITLVTWAVFRESYIFFGVLHFIALASVLGVFFVRVSYAWIAVVALLSFALPLAVSAPLFDLPGLQWIGLVSETPFTNDYVPLFPWFGVYLLGLALGRVMGSPGNLSSPAFLYASPRTKAVRALQWVGRQSLLLYMVHQPILFGLVFAASIALAPGNTDRSGFLQSCQGGCEGAGAAPAACARYCGCALKGAQGSDDFPALTARCAARHLPGNSN